MWRAWKGFLQAEWMVYRLANVTKKVMHVYTQNISYMLKEDFSSTRHRESESVNGQLSENFRLYSCCLKRKSCVLSTGEWNWNRIFKYDKALLYCVQFRLSHLIWYYKAKIGAKKGNKRLRRRSNFTIRKGYSTLEQRVKEDVVGRCKPYSVYIMYRNIFLHLLLSELILEVKCRAA